MNRLEKPQLGETQAMVYAYLSTLKPFCIAGTDLQVAPTNIIGGNPITLDLDAHSDVMTKRAILYCMKFWLRRNLRVITTQLLSVSVENTSDEHKYKASVEILQ